MASDDLRARIAEALMAWAETNNAPQYASMRRPATVVANANSRADAVMTVVGPELERLHRALDDARSELYQLRTRPAIGAGTPLVCSDERHAAKVKALEGEAGDWRKAAYQHARERDTARTACRSAAVLLRSVADEGSGVGALLDAARALDDVAGPERPWLTDPPTPCAPVPCDDCPICKTHTKELER